LALYCIESNQAPPDAPALVLLHGIFGTASNLAVIARALAADYRVISFDLPNHGRSSHSDAMSFTSMADAVCEAMNEQDIASAHLLGHSMGGKVAMQIAASSPDRVNKLIVSDIAPVEYRPHHNKILDGLNSIDLERLESRRDAEQQLAVFIDESFVRQYLLKNLYRNDEGEFAWRMNLKVITQCYDQLVLPLREGEPFIGETLFIKGELSNYIRPEHQATIEHWFPHASFKMIQGAGHWLHAEKPVAFNNVVRKFLAGF
jgi:esterase